MEAPRPVETRRTEEPYDRRTRRVHPGHLDGRQGVDDRARTRPGRARPPSQGAQIIAFQELFYGPYFGITQDTAYYDYAESVPGPTTERFAALAKELGIVIVLPVYEEDQPGVLYNTAAVIDADGTLPRQVPQAPHPAPAQVLGEVLLPPRQPRVPGVRDGGRQDRREHLLRPALPGGLARARRSTAPRSCSTPTPPRPGISNKLWEIEQPAAAVANGYFVVANNRVGLEDNEYGDEAVNFYGSSYAVGPDGNYVGEVGSSSENQLIDPRPRPRPDPRWCASAGSSSATAGPTPTARSSLPDAHGGTAMNDAHHRRHRGQRDRARRPPTCSSTARRSPPCSRPGSTLLGFDLAANVDQVIDATGKYVIPGGIDAHTHMELPFGGTERLRHVRDRHPGRGLGRDDDDHRLRRAAHGRARHGRARRLAREGRRQLRDRLRLPPDRRRRRRRLAQGDGRASSPRA